MNNRRTIKSNNPCPVCGGREWRTFMKLPCDADWLEMLGPLEALIDDADHDMLHQIDTCTNCETVIA